MSPENARSDGAMGTEIATEMVALTKEFMGRGPNAARTYQRDNLIAVVLRDSLTKAEKRLAQSSKSDFVSELRRQFQSAMQEDAIAIIERLTERRVISFMSDHDVSTDTAVELFLLEPLAREMEGADAG
jgi:uncharacterized protein YbcI